MDRPSNTWIPGFKTLKGAIKVSKLEVGLELSTYPFRQLTNITLPFIMLKMFAAGSASLNRKATNKRAYLGYYGGRLVLLPILVWYKAG
jgi:hypothetical protein